MGACKADFMARNEYAKQSVLLVCRSPFRSTLKDKDKNHAIPLDLPTVATVIQKIEEHSGYHQTRDG